jgi:hypothetical protein
MTGVLVRGNLNTGNKEKSMKTQRHVNMKVGRQLQAKEKPGTIPSRYSAQEE